MTETVLDASVILKWFRIADEPHAAAAETLRRSFQAGTLTVVAPHLLHLEILNVAGRRWRWQATELADLAMDLEALPFEMREPLLSDIATWTARGLTAYDASYVALAASEQIALVTDDRRILELAPGVARPLSKVD